MMFWITACALLAAAAPADAQMHRGHDDPHSRGAAMHSHYFRPPARYHDAHHYYEGEVFHGHRLMYRNGAWGYAKPGGIFIHLSL